MQKEYISENAAFKMMQFARTMKPLEFQVFSHLMSIPEFKGSYTDLTLAMGQKKQNSPNVRKAVLNMVKKHMICLLENQSNVKGGKIMFICDNWQNDIINNGEV